MGIVTLDEAKKHLKVDQDSEDTLITRLIQAAEESIEKYIQCTIPNKNLPTPNVPASIKQAALLIISDLYENRGANMDVELKINPSFAWLLDPYRKNMGM